MIYFQRLFYLFYYLKTTNFKQLKDFIQYSKSVSGKSGLRIKADMVLSVFKYNISLKDYFYFRFFESQDKERSKWAGTGLLYEYQLRMNPIGSRELLENKVRFLEHYRLLIKRKFFHIYDSTSDSPYVSMTLNAMLNNPSGKLVLKGSRGQVGAEVEVVTSGVYTPHTLLSYMKQHNYDLVEEFVMQHPTLNDLSPSGLNTVRIITQLDNDEVIFLAARLRVSVDSPVDNMAAGNIAAPVDLKTGIVTGPGVFSDITRGSVRIHPVTGKEIVGFRIPHWENVLDLAGTAARNASGNKSVGWDIAVTEEGAELIEGNHNWCKLLWQLPVSKGLKAELMRYQ